MFKDASVWFNDGKLIKQIPFIDVDKFILCIFNLVKYNWEIISFFTISFLL